MRIVPHSLGEPWLPLTRTIPTAPGKSSKPSAKRKSDALDDDDDDEASAAKNAKNQAAKETPSGCEGSSGQPGT